ncbi:DUF4974 domain-containing protein, partial [Bacteroides xylanisolvens]|uniref:DUF4974 domain-containing protein n=1 Tax=Bacteroides xylanisolvens TaxID=371601 RepID=UPI001F0314F1
WQNPEQLFVAQELINKVKSKCCGIKGNMYLEDIFTSLERKFPYAFVYSLHSLKKNTYSFRFSKQANLEEVMKIISQVVGNVNYVIKGNKCYVTSKE